MIIAFSSMFSFQKNSILDPKHMYQKNKPILISIEYIKNNFQHTL